MKNNKEDNGKTKPKKSEILEKPDKTTMSERKRHKGKMNRQKTKPDQPLAKPEAKIKDTKPSPTRNRTNITNKTQADPGFELSKS